VYVAWADCTLTYDEIDTIGKIVKRQTWLDAAARQSLARWLDPGAPPTARQLQQLLITIRRLARDLPRERRSLAQLGIDLARRGAETIGDWDAPEAERALAEIEDVLGVIGSEASQELIAVSVTAPPPEEALPEFDVSELTALLDGEHAETRERVFAILDDPQFVYEYGLDKAVYRERVLEWCRALAANGVGALSFPEAYGGRDDLGAFITAFETLAFFDLSLLIKFGVQFGLFGGSVERLGTERHHERYLTDIGTMALPGCFAMSETGHGSNVRDLETVARFDAEKDEFVIHTPSDHARKDWIGNAALHGRMATVFAQLEIGDERHGVHAFLVPIRTTKGKPARGIRIEDCGHKLGLNGVDNGRIWFDKVHIPRENLLNRFADVSADGAYSSPIVNPSRRFFTMLGTLVGGRISVAAAALSAAKSGLTIAVHYGQRRRQFGPAGEPELVILDYLTHQRRLMPRLAAAYAFDFAIKYLADRFINRRPEEEREIETLAAGIKALSTWQTTDTLQTCREACGGKGYLAENRIADLKADTDVFTTFEGDNTVLLQLVAKGLLTQYKHQFGELKLFGAVKFLVRRTARGALALNPVTTHLTDEDHPRDPDFHVDACRFRERRLLASVAGRLRDFIEDGHDTTSAFNTCQDHLVSLAKAYAERVVVEQFAICAQAVEDESYGPALKTLSDLYALWRIEQDRGWFLESGFLSQNKSKAIRTLVNRLCGDVRGDALALVDAFGIPEKLLGAPIGI
jgi:acyl-CoA oxidase